MLNIIPSEGLKSCAKILQKSCATRSGADQSGGRQFQYDIPDLSSECTNNFRESINMISVLPTCKLLLSQT